MKLHSLTTALSLLSLPALTGTVLAGGANFSFDTDPSGILDFTGNAQWRASGGVGGSGYLSITDALNGQVGKIVFDDFDGGAIVTAFTFSADLRTGGGTGDPADGYSVSFVRGTDPVLTAPGAGDGFAGPPEEGTQTGVSVGLDEWFSGNAPGVPDVIGVSVRVDGVLVNQTALPTKNGSAADTTSLQTGPAGVPVDENFDVPGHSFVNLTMKMDADGTLDVSYKGAPILTNFATPYFPSAGRIVLAGRTGGANSHHHVDNIVISTTAATTPLINSASISATKFNAVVFDSASSIVDTSKPYSVTVDGNPVAAVATKLGTNTTFAFTTTPPALFAPGAHAVVITLKDTNNNSYILNRSATTGPYLALNAAWKAGPGQVNTTTPSFLSTVHQLRFGRGPGDANLLPLPERQLANGYFDTTLPGIAENVIDSVATPPAGVTQQPDGSYVVEGVLNWDQDGANQGNFTGLTGFPETRIPGIPGTTASTDNIVAEFFTWIELPAGETTLGFNSDDGFTASFGPTALDFFTRQVAGQFNGGRGAADTTFTVAVPAAGLYPVRLLWWEGGGGANLEFFSVLPDGTKVLVNDAANADSLKAYYAGLPAKPSIHLIAPYPTTAFQCDNQHPIQIDLVDGVATVTDASIVLKVDGNTVARTLSGTGYNTRISFAPPAGKWTAGVHTVNLTYSDSTAASRTETWTFDAQGTAYAWERGGDDPNNILDPTNWLNDLVPPNDGTNINLGPGELITFAGSGLTIPNNGGREINLAAGAQIIKGNTNGQTRVEARINAAGTGPDGNGFFYVQGGDWGLPNNVALTANATTTANGDRLRFDGGVNRLDLGTFTLTMKGTSENNLVNTTLTGQPGSRLILQNFTAFEASTKTDPNVTVELAPGVTLSSWSGRGNRRENAFVLHNNSALETRQQDNDLTFTGPITVGAGETGILRPQNGDGTQMRLAATGPIQGGGAIRKENNATLILSGNSSYTGGTVLQGGENSATVAASNTAFGAGAVTVATPSVVQITNGGAAEYRDSSGRGAPLGDSTGFHPTLAALHAGQPFDNTRWSYTGKVNNPTDAPLLVTFAENYDDDVYLTVDDQVLLDNGSWNTATTGQVNLAPGAHDLRVSVFNGGGGAGPADTWNFDDNATRRRKGVGWSFTQPEGAASIAADDYTGVGATFEVYQPEDRLLANNIVINAPATLSTQFMNGWDATLSGVLSGGGALTIGGDTLYTTDDLILSATSTYTGPTTVTSGASLIVNGNNSAATGPVTVASGGALGGSGTVGGVAMVSGSIAPGSNGIGTLNIAGTTWNAGDRWTYQLGAPGTGDRLAISGNFTKGTGAGFAFNFLNTGAAGSYTLVTWTGSTTFVAGDFTAENLGATNLAGTFSMVGKSLVLTVPVSPYATWASSAFAPGTSSADRLPGADPDGDGISNVMEYALNSNPSAVNATPAPEVVTVGADQFLQISWTRPNNRTDITTTGQISVDLMPSPNWLPATTTITPAGAGMEMVVIRDLQAIGAGPRNFIRAKVTNP